MTTKAGSNSEVGSKARANLDFSSWPAEPGDVALAGWLEVRRKKRAPVGVSDMPCAWCRMNNCTSKLSSRPLMAAEMEGWAICN